MKTCNTCNAPFEPKLETQLYCSPKCRVRAHRGVKRDTVTNPPVTNVVTNPPSVSDPTVTTGDDRDPRKVVLPQSALDALSDEDRELYRRYQTEPFSFTPNWIQKEASRRE